MTVGEYAAKLEALSKHFRFFQVRVDEAYLCNRFLRGLRNEIEKSVRPLGIRVCQQVVEKAREVEAMENRQRGQTGNGGPVRSGQSQSGRYSGQKAAGRFDKGKAPMRKPYQRPTDRVPFAGKGASPAPKDDVAAVTDDLIQVTCVIAGNSLMVLFDSGATHSFIAEECVEKLGLLTADLPFDLVVTTPAADRLVTRTTCLRCPLIYEDRKFFANLICLGLKELNVILGMD
ncbi:uncharacterized protein LOC130736115 [Lotus japonicus]|uniref:uncharacterized protein LOC130736115 n=1 Tax=Lotus japonicus TaxID=34305 RepID=UPI002586BF3F|nr:uncharacterized protein LOC130736115 [Lotus japonicus]